MPNIALWNDVKNRIHERLLSSEWHADQLCQLVKINAAADIWRTWYVDLGDLLGDHSITAVTYKLLQTWGITLDELENAACLNDTRTYTVRNMGEIVGIMMTPPASEDAAMYVVSNEACFFGAVGVLDKHMQAKLAAIFPAGCFILPSSVHECIAVSGKMDADELARMVFQINRAEVEERDRLSDHVFQIDDGRLIVAA